MLKAWFEKNMGHLKNARKHAEGAAHTVRAGGEAAIVGAALGAADAHLKTGLDMTVNIPGTGTVPASGGVATNPKQAHVPIDGVVAVTGLLGGIALAAHEDGLGQDARNVGSSALAVFSFRKMRDYSAKQMKMANQTPGYQNTPAFAATIGVGTTPPAAHGMHGAYSDYSQPPFTFRGEQQPVAIGEDPIVALSRQLTG